MKVLFVCLGNICRSPTAHGVFVHHLKNSELAGRVEVDSAGTGAWHAGEPPDKRAQQEAQSRGIDLSFIRARQVNAEDFERFDMILAMDKQNLRDLRAVCPEVHQHKLRLFLEFGDTGTQEVPDPYYGGSKGFQHVFDLVDQTSLGLLETLRRKV
ncbi:MAG: low molecular weight protein-tyrosine-phosphatase [Oleiphilaceae bacterium]|nr:low molecular weight protein-tyrosine-phosphatase [Oleiphilaceae bacterium]